MLSTKEASPFMRVRGILEVRWAVASSSCCPMLRDRALPSLLSCSTATGWRPPRESAMTGMKAMFSLL